MLTNDSAVRIVELMLQYNVGVNNEILNGGAFTKGKLKKITSKQLGKYLRQDYRELT